MSYKQVIILTSENHQTWPFLKQHLFSSIKKLPETRQEVLSDKFDFNQVTKISSQLNESTALIVLDHKNINIQCILSIVPKVSPHVHCYLYVDDLFIETALRFDVLPFNSFQNIFGAFIYPTTAFKNFCQGFFPKATNLIQNFPCFSQNEIPSIEERNTLKAKYNLHHSQKTVLIPLALRRDSNILYLLKTIFETNKSLLENDPTLHICLSLGKEESSIPLYLISLPQGHVFQEITQFIKTLPENLQNRIHFYDDFSEEILWISDVLIDISTTLPYTMREECALAQECGLSIIASTWGLCQKNIISEPHSQLSMIDINVTNQGVEIDHEQLVHGINDAVKNSLSWEKRVSLALETRKRRKENSSEFKLSEYSKYLTTFGTTTWKLRYHSQNLKEIEKPLSLQSFEGHLYEFFAK